MDRAVFRDCKSRKTNFGLVSIDYMKANDSVQHTWILECLKLYKMKKDTKSPHQALNGAVEIYSGSKFKAICPS